MNTTENHNPQEEEIQFKDQKAKTVLELNSFNKRSFKLAFLFLLSLVAYLFVSMPVMSFKFSSGIIFLVVVISIFTALLIKNKKIALSIFAIGMLFYAGITVLSSPILRADDYYNLIGDVKQVSYQEEQPNIDNTRLIVVDYANAMKLGEKVLGESVGLGSQFTIGDYYLVETADDIAWVAPLEPLNFFKWFQNREGMPGYVYVSATNPNDVRLVQELNSEPIKIKYTQNAYFFKDIERYVYFQGHMTHGLTDYSFEIDDEGRPYWVITTYVPQIGVSGNDTTGVVLVDAQTGETDYYTNLEELPEWIERVHPTQFIAEQLNYWGAFKNGFINTILSQKDMIKTTEGNSYAYVDGEPHYYTGVTSIASDESTVGFILVNLRTKDTTFYTLTGATETAAMKSAEGQVQQYSYYATYPMLLNEFGKPTYFMTLKDGEGLVKQYAFVSVENYNIVGVGTTVDEARQNYYQELQANGTTLDTGEELEPVVGEVEVINYVDGVFYIKLVDNKDLYTVRSEVSKILPYTTPGDMVEIQAINAGEYLSITSFVNKDLE